VQAGLGDSSAAKPATGLTELQILFAPDTKASFKASILSTLRQAVAKVETQTLLNYFSKELNKSGAETGNEKPMDDFVGFREISTIDTPEEALKLNSVQHNVPAWTIFGMFFIVISMAGSIIKERDDGSYTRLLTMPGNYITILGGKISAYLIVCLLQCVLMLLAGYFLLPLMGLPRLVIGSATGALLLIAVCTGLAATGFGVFVGTVFRTHQQASTFGAVSVVILAALGGIWIPVFVMPENIRLFAELSPLYWSLSAFHKIFLNNAGLQAVIPYAIKLIVFFLLALTGSWLFNRSRNR
jgi:ABC-2 type transport system permease protein